MNRIKLDTTIKCQLTSNSKLVTIAMNKYFQYVCSVYVFNLNALNLYIVLECSLVICDMYDIT